MKKQQVYIAIAIVAAVVLYFVLRPKKASEVKPKMEKSPVMSAIPKEPVPVLPKPVPIPPRPQPII